MSDYDKAEWQAEQLARDTAQSAYRDKMAKARERSARNAKRKIARLHAKLTELGHISDFEDEFGESVLERLEKFGSAFHDLEKGRAGDALSAAQKQVVSRMNKKVKELKAKSQKGGEEIDPDTEYERTTPAWKKNKTSSFKSNHRFTPRVRNLDEDMEAEEQAFQEIDFSNPKIEPFIPRYNARAEATLKTPNTSGEAPKTASDTKRPFLRIVPK